MINYSGYDIGITDTEKHIYIPMNSEENEVILLGTYGGDIEHAQSAWCSTKTSAIENKARIPKLLYKLASEGHHTPFEKSSLHFLVTTDIATHIQLLKHRVGVSINAESARYKEIKENKYYIPNDWPDHLQEKLRKHIEAGNELYHEVCNELTPSLGRARAKESSRFFRNYATQITSDIMFNWRSFAHFYKLRHDLAAQKEIRDLAEKMMSIIKNYKNDEGVNPFEETIKAFGF